MELEKIVRLAAASYVSSVMFLHTLRTVVQNLEPETLQRFGSEIELSVEAQGTVGSASLATLAEIQEACTEDEWFAFHAALPDLKMLDDDIARYRALVAMDRAGVPLPDQDSEAFQFGPDAGEVRQ